MSEDSADGTGEPGSERRFHLTSEDAARIMSPGAGWHPTLTGEQVDELVALVKPAFKEETELLFRRFVGLIFSAAVERYIAFSEEKRRGHVLVSHPVTPRVLLRRELDKAAQRLRDPGQVMQEEVSPALQGVIEIALEEEIPPEVRAAGSFSKWIRALPEEAWRDLLLRAIERVEVEVKRGPSNVIDRLMVRSLAQFVAGLTGVVPSRTYLHENKNGGRGGEAYWFLDLSIKLAVFVNAALPPKHRRPGVSALTGIVAEELEALKKAEPSSALPGAGS
jgi:hypothetical protein